MAITRREADIRRDEELDKAVWLYSEPETNSRRCCVCGEGFYDGYLIGEDEICSDCFREQCRLAARYLAPIFAERLEDVIAEEAVRV